MSTLHCFLGCFFEKLKTLAKRLVFFTLFSSFATFRVFESQYSNTGIYVVFLKYSHERKLKILETLSPQISHDLTEARTLITTITESQTGLELPATLLLRVIRHNH